MTSSADERTFGAVSLWIVIALGFPLVGVAAILPIRRWADRASVRTVHRFGARANRVKLERKQYIRDTLLANHAIAAAAELYAKEQGVPEAEAWDRMDRYIDEIVPFFNILAYY